MKSEALLSRLIKVRAVGADSWVACCPAHDDKHPSMTVRELDDGTVLVHCFAGCSVEQILGAVGLEFDALFPDKPKDRLGIRRPYPAHAVLAALESECLIVRIVADDIAAGREVSDADRERVRLASRRISEGKELAGG